MTLIFDLLIFKLKIGIQLTVALGNVYTNFDFSTFFRFRLTSSHGTGRQTDGQTDRRTDRSMGKTRNAAYSN